MTTAVEAPTRTEVHDARAFWRVLLALVVPVPWLAKGIQYVVAEHTYDHSAQQIRDWSTDHTYQGLQWLDALFVVLVVPSILAMVLVSRRGAPRLTTWATVVMGGGFLLVLTLGGGSDPLSWVAADEGYDPAATGKFIDAVVSSPRAGLGDLGFIAAILIGSVLVGIALWKSKAVHAWAAALVGLGGCTHPFLSFQHTVHGAGLVLLAVGCLGVSEALLRMSDDEFDVPPRS